MAFSIKLNNGQPCCAQRVPIGEMSGMKDMMYETRTLMNGEKMPDEGFKISTEGLRKDPNLVKAIRQRQGFPHVNITGSRNENDDKALLELAIRHCAKSTKKLTLSRMIINMPAEKLQAFPKLEELKFDSCSVENESILSFNEWCPNVNKLTLAGLKLGLTAYKAFIVSENTFPNVTTLTLNFKNSLKITRGILKVFSSQFPMVKELDIIMCPNENVSADQSKYNVAYQALYFKNVEKLFVRAFAGEIDKLFDYMAISNEKLTSFSFAGMAVTDELADWIKSCKQMDELTVDWQYRAADAGCSVNNIKDTQSLTKVTLNVKYLDWHPTQIIQFARDNPRLRMLVVEGEQQHKKMTFGQQFKDMFADLIKKRGSLTIKVLIFEDDREMEISEKGFSDKNITRAESECDEGDMMMRMCQMITHFNSRI